MGCEAVAHFLGDREKVFRGLDGAKAIAENLILGRSGQKSSGTFNGHLDLPRIKNLNDFRKVTV